MKSSRLRAPLRVLEELLGAPQSDGSLDKSSRQFVFTFERTTVAVFDFHKPEWRERPECETDAHYVWRVDAEREDVSRFCAWLSAEVMKKVPAAGADAYRWPLPGDPHPTPAPPPKPAPKAVAPLVRSKTSRPAPPPIDAHRLRVGAFQRLLEQNDDVSLAELRADLARLSKTTQRLAETLAAEPELTEAEVRERLGHEFDGAAAELDGFLKRQR